jgi:hypothetical protein
VFLSNYDIKLLQYQNKLKILTISSRHDTGLMHEVQLISAERESETEGKGGKVCGSNLMI